MKPISVRNILSFLLVIPLLLTQSLGRELRSVNTRRLGSPSSVASMWETITSETGTNDRGNMNRHRATQSYSYSTTSTTAVGNGSPNGQYWTDDGLLYNSNTGTYSTERNYESQRRGFSITIPILPVIILIVVCCCCLKNRQEQPIRAYPPLASKRVVPPQEIPIASKVVLAPQETALDTYHTLPE